MSKRVYYDLKNHRIGDKVVISAAFNWHRKKYPEDWIIAVDRPWSYDGRLHSLPSNIIFENLIDECTYEIPPDATQLIIGSVWVCIPWLVQQGIYPSIKVDSNVEERLLEHYCWMKKSYVCVHILQDAQYNRCRNHGFGDMCALIYGLTSLGVHVVRIGKNFSNPIPYCTDLTKHDLSVMESACVIKHCQVYIGGDTGMSHVAAALDVPSIVAIYGAVDYEEEENTLPSFPPNRLTTIIMHNHRLNAPSVVDDCFSLLSTFEWPRK